MLLALRGSYSRGAIILSRRNNELHPHLYGGGGQAWVSTEQIRQINTIGTADTIERLPIRHTMLLAFGRRSAGGSGG